VNFHTLLQERDELGKPIRVGVIGAGKFGAMFLAQARRMPGIHLVGIADLDPERAFSACERTGWSRDRLELSGTSNTINQIADRGKTAITESSDELIQADLDVVLEITGVPEAGIYHAWNALDAGKHVVMVNVEADSLAGKALADKASSAGLVYSMAYGDQPALISELIDWARAIGMDVVCAGKGTRYQPEYHYSTPDTIWGYYGFSEEQVASGDYNAKMFNSFLDGTKSSIEMCAVSNASGLTPQKCGLQFPPVGIDNLMNVLIPASDGGVLEHSGTVEVIASENRDGSPVARDLRWGVYITFKAPSDYVKRCFAEYGMLTDASGAYASLYRPYHLIGLELGISVASAALRGEPTGSTKAFNADVAAVAKKDLQPGDTLDGEGGYTVFGRLAGAQESLGSGYLPLGLSGNAKVVRQVSRGSILTYQDVELDESLFSYQVRKEMEREKRKSLGI